MVDFNIQDRPKPADTSGDRCTDYDQDCHVANHDHFWCWKIDPTTGVCPFLTGEIRV